MIVQYDGFQWDEGNIVHCAKHGVSREEIEHVLAHMTFYIPDLCPHEPRMRTVGVIKESRHVFIIFTFRELEDERYMRPVSPRYMHEKEVENYEQRKNA